MVHPTFTVWSSEAVATLARGPPKPQCRSVMGRVWRDQTCRGAGVLEESPWSTLQEKWIQGEGCTLMPPTPMWPLGPSHWQNILRWLPLVPGQTSHPGPPHTSPPTCRPQIPPFPAPGLQHGLLQSRLPCPLC